MNRAERNAQRRASYAYYRSCGYGSALAASVRGRTRSAWQHYFETGKREGRSAPALKSSKSAKASIRKELREVYGLPSKIASNWSRLKEESFQFRLKNLRSYIKAMQETMNISRAEAVKMLKEHLKGVKTQAEIGQAFKEFYEGVVGFPG